MDQNNYQDRSVQQPAAEEKTKPRRRRADMYQQQGNAANVTNAETAKPAVEDVSGTTQKMPPIRSTFQRNADRHPLHDFSEIPGRVLRRQNAEA